VCLCVYYCSTYYKAVRVGGGGGSGEHVLRETMNRGLCGLVCPSHWVYCFNTYVQLFAWGRVCVFITAVPITKLFAWGGGGQWRTCATRDYGQRPVLTSLPITLGLLLQYLLYISSRGGVCVCLLLQYLLQSCSLGGGEGQWSLLWRTCATRDYEPRPVWTVCVYYCSTYYKAVRVGGWDP
jgi:hypothetical protein